MLSFITGNRNKFEEVAAILGGEVEQVDIDLPEIQDVDARNVVRAKLLEALRHRDGACIIEDTSLYLESLKGLPGPLIKWFLATIGTGGLVDIVERLGNRRAEAKTIIGYARSRDDIAFFEGVVPGTIVPVRAGVSGFGWDVIFQPDGHDRTFAEMTFTEKNSVSMRRIAVEKLRTFLHQSAEARA